MIPEKDPEPDSTMSIRQYDIDGNIKDGRTPDQDGPRESVVQHLPTAQHSPMDPLQRSESKQAGMVDDTIFE